MERNLRKTRVGKVVSDKMDKTIVVAIEDHIKHPLYGEICRHIKHGGMFITSGIINTKEQDVKDAMNANPELEIVETTYQGDWVSITARRK